MRYTVRHVTRFTYDTPITESVMEARMQPRSDGTQRCLHFALTTAPQSRVMMYRDHDGNTVHHFDIPARHSRLVVTAESLVDCTPGDPLPERAADGAWDALDRHAAAGEWYEFLAPSTFAKPSPLLESFADELGLTRDDDPAHVLRRMMEQLFLSLEYRPRTTRVDSPIDDALQARAGVCQDVAHIFIALARRLGVPSRYVSGYLYHSADSHDRSSADTTHAWVESFLPDLGWVGFDPTNNVLAADRHIRVAIGRDYADVPPTRGVYKGTTAVRTELAVAVRVGPVKPAGDLLPFTPWMSRDAGAPVAETLSHDDQQQQQQQQQ